MYDLTGKIAVITGAGGEHGIGRAIAVRLAQEGAYIVVNDLTSNPPKLKLKAPKNINNGPGKFLIKVIIFVKLGFEFLSHIV